MSELEEGRSVWTARNQSSLWSTLQIDPQPWKADANCRGLDPAMFILERGDTKGQEAAKEVCKGCSVTAECLEYGFEEKAGIWGGTSERQRRVLRRRRAAAS